MILKHSAIYRYNVIMSSHIELHGKERPEIFTRLLDFTRSNQYNLHVFIIVGAAAAKQYHYHYRPAKTIIMSLWNNVTFGPNCFMKIKIY